MIEEDTETKYNSPLIVACKKDGGIRLVNNFIKLNEKTVQNRYQMANANELMYRAAAVKTVSKTEQAKNWKYQKKTVT